MKKITKVETIEEFIARGGKPVILPPQEIENNQQIRLLNVGLPTLMSLDEGEHFFGETRKKKKKEVTKEEFKDKIKNSGLPDSVIQSLLGGLGAKRR